ncbi:MAG TPA: thiamine/thiamine pyrophosphate ABC transporter permease ThiP, partial [Rhizobiales bacterium]|nr:thiamine/thiamine pyrophosphate ABC transporter permease ThiP [Hyphomicrobiales bacterium]
GALAGAALENGIASIQLLDAYYARVIGFTLWQAGLSAILSAGLAVPVARALARQSGFAGRTQLLWLFALPLALPGLVVVLGVLGVWGKHGWVMALARWFGLDPGFSVFGLTGILLAHVFFNMPLAVRLILGRLDSVPVETWRLADQLGLGPRALFFLVEWPVIRAVLGGVAGLVFMLCLASFTVVLTLGGGPAATTIEVAIYQALRFDFDPAKAVFLALIQLAITVFVLLALRTARTGMALAAPVRLKGVRRDGGRPVARWLDGIVIFFAGGFLVLPLAALLADGIAGQPWRLLLQHDVQQALVTSLVIAFCATLLSLFLCWSLIRAGQVYGRLFSLPGELSASATLVMPPVLLGAGWFVLLYRLGDVFAMAGPVVIVINALMALPFVYRVLAPAMAQSAQANERLCASLGLAGLARWKYVDWPVLRRPLAVAGSFAMAMSLGDLGAIALFGSQDLITLPLLLFQRLGSYRSADAAGLALLLGLLCLGIIYSAGRLAPGERGISA